MNYLVKWKILIIAALAQTVGQIFDVSVYPVTSNAGELALLMGVTFFLYLAQDDLVLTAGFADFLHSSNQAFSHAALRQSELEREQHAEAITAKANRINARRGAGAGGDAGARRGSNSSGSSSTPAGSLEMTNTMQP